MKRLILFLLLAPALHAQTAIPIQNPSFEAAQPLVNGSSAGPWEQGTIPGWAVTGTAGLWQPSSYTALPDGKTVAWSNGGSVAQDLGVAAQANTTYYLTVYVGHRADDFPAAYTITLNVGTLCTLSGSTANIPLGTFKQVALACPVTAIPPTNLVITLASSGVQANFDAVSLTSAPSIPPQLDSIKVFGRLLWCTVCPPAPYVLTDPDNIPATGFLLVSQTGGVQSSSALAPDGSVTVAGTIDVAQDPLEFTVQLTDANGTTQPGASITWNFPQWELNSASFLLSKVNLGTIRIAHAVKFNATDCLAPVGCPAVRIVDTTGFSLSK